MAADRKPHVLTELEEGVLGLSGVIVCIIGNCVL